LLPGLKLLILVCKWLVRVNPCPEKQKGKAYLRQ
jgi:hypothetical protein